MFRNAKEFIFVQFRSYLLTLFQQLYRLYHSMDSFVVSWNLDKQSNTRKDATNLKLR